MLLSETDIENLKKEIVYNATRSSGPGGQNVNKVSSKIEIRFSITGSKVLNAEQIALILEKLSYRLTTGDELIVTSQEDRSQLKNKQIATDRLIHLLQRALTPVKSRKPSRPTKSSVEKRLEMKKHRSLLKQNRRSNDF